MRTVAMFLILVVATAVDGQETKVAARVVHCAWATATCDERLSVSGAWTSVVTIAGLPAAATTADVVVQTHEGNNVILAQQPVVGGTLNLTVYKYRSMQPLYQRPGRSPEVLAYVASAFMHSSIPADKIVLRGKSPRIDVLATASGERRNIGIEVEYRRWMLESGGFYTYTWARDDTLLTEPAPAVDEVPQTRVIRKVHGDPLGPTTGVTFVFHRADYPEAGFEFGTSTGGDRPTTFYLGLVQRLLSVGDTILLSVSAGLAHASVKHFDDIAGGTYPAADVRLTERSKYVNRAYIALGFAIKLGGNTDQTP